MHKKKSFFFRVFLFVFVSFLIIFLSRTPFLQSIFSFFTPILLIPQKLLVGGGSTGQGSTIDKLREENRFLSKKIVDQKNLENEVKALRDQFQTTTLTTSELLPAQIIGSPSFIPGVTFPEYYILDKGEADGVKVAQTVVVKNNLVGFIEKTSYHTARVAVVSQKDTSFTAKTSTTGAIGVVRGKGNGDIVFDNVLLSDTLKASDLVVTKGDVSLQGTGIMPNLVVGKIAAIDKKPSALFQVAKIQSLLDFSHLSMVFVVIFTL